MGIGVGGINELSVIYADTTVEFSCICFPVAVVVLAGRRSVRGHVIEKIGWRFSTRTARGVIPPVCVLCDVIVRVKLFMPNSNDVVIAGISVIPDIAVVYLITSGATITATRVSASLVLFPYLNFAASAAGSNLSAVVKNYSRTPSIIMRKSPPVLGSKSFVATFS